MRNIFVTLLGVALAMTAMAGCSAGSVPAAANRDGNTAPADNANAAIPTSSNTAPTDATPVDDAAKAAVVAGNTRFAADLYQKLRAQDGNLFLSPYSVSVALAMTSAGARGRTAEQMARVLHLPSDTSLHPAFAALIRGLNGSDAPRAYQLNVVNSLWGQRGAEFLAAFRDTLKRDYGSELREVDYQRDPEQARTAINAWVAEQTADKIKELLAPRTVDDSTMLVLVNAIYFKAAWQTPFRKESTVAAPFQLGAGGQVSVPMMKQSRSARYFDGGDFQALELPYTGGDLSMYVLLPKKTDGLARLEQSVTAENLDAWLKRLTLVDADITLPKFKITSEFTLVQTLREMGMADAFGDGADFTGMSASGRLRISAVVHQAFVDVDEDGTEAAAATAVGVTATGMPVRREKVTFTADHPFFFFIRDNRSGSLLFAGRVANPQ